MIMSAQSNTAMLGQAKGVNENLGELVKAFATAFPLHSNTGSFTMAAANVKAVADTAIRAGSIIYIMPTNAAAATLMAGANSLYCVRTAGVGFTATTAGGGNAAGTETFDYLAVTIG